MLFRSTLECSLLPFCDDTASISAQTPGVTHEKAIKGMLIVFVSKVENLPVPKEEASSFVKVTVGDQEFKTSTVAFDPKAAAAAEETTSQDGGESSKAIEQSVLNPEFNTAFQITIDSDPPADGINFELMNGSKSLGVHNIAKDIFEVMRDELRCSEVDIGGAILHCGVQALGLQVSDNSPAATSETDETGGTPTATNGTDENV